MKFSKKEIFFYFQTVVINKNTLIQINDCLPSMKLNVKT